MPDDKDKAVDPLIETAEFFLEKMKITKGARYDADRRLKRKSSVSLASISLLSIYVIAASLFVFAFGDTIDAATSRYFTMSSVILAALILFLNAFEFSKQYDLRAEKMRMSAQRVSEVFNEFDARLYNGDVDKKYLYEKIEQYNMILKEFSENHDDIDFLHHKYGRGRKKPVLESDYEDKSAYKKGKKIDSFMAWRRLKIKLNWMWEIYGTFFFFVVLPPCVIFAIYVFFVLPAAAATGAPEAVAP